MAVTNAISESSLSAACSSWGALTTRWLQYWVHWPFSLHPSILRGASWSLSACLKCFGRARSWNQHLLIVAYLGAGVLFILSLGGLSTQESAQRGNRYGIIGMIIALAATLLHEEIGSYVGSAKRCHGRHHWCGFGHWFYSRTTRVKMTEMPELVAILHSFVGLAAVLVGFSVS